MRCHRGKACGIWDAGDFEIRRGDEQRQIETKPSSMKSPRSRKKGILFSTRNAY